MKHLMRKHGKIIMTVMGVVLMITFSLPTFRGGGSDPGSVLLGRLNGRKVYNLEVQSAYSELALLKSLGIPTAVSQDEPDGALHWYLLVQEATQRGFVANPEVIRDQVDQLIKDSAQAADIVNNSGPRFVTEAVTHWTMVNELYDSVAGAKIVSLPQIEYAADWAFSTVDIAYATLDASTGWEKESTPTDQQIQQQFDLYKGVIPPSAVLPDSPFATPPLIDGHSYPFGYKFPDRAHVEYLVFDRAKLLAGFTPTQEDYDHAEEYWRANPTDPDIAAATQPGVPTTAAVKPFAEVKDLLAKREMEKRASREMDKIIALVQAADPWQKGVADDATVPSSQWPDFQKLRDEIAKSFHGYTPAYHNSLDTRSEKGLLGPGDLARLPGIGDAWYRVGTPPIDYSFATLASNVRDLVKLSTKDQLGRIQGMQVGAEGPPLHDKDDNIYIYRVLDVEPSREARLDEVRDQVVEDLKKLAFYKHLQTDAASLATAVRIGAPDAGGGSQLAAIAKARNPAIPVATASGLTRWRANLPADVAAVKGFLDAAFSTITPDVLRLAADRLKQPMSAQAASQPAFIAPHEPHVTTLDNDSGLKVYVLALQRYATVPPVNLQTMIRADLPSEYQQAVNVAQILQARGRPEDALRAAGGAAQLQRLMEQTGDWSQRAFAQKWFSLKAIVARLHYDPAPGHALSTSTAPAT